jgi:DNA helicase-2/ATP-dependent DNA helicase PcrA
LPRPRHEIEQEDDAAQRQPQYRSGQTVRHASFGTGTVIESKVTGDDEEVHVAFPDGVKRLAASFAKLEIVEEGE